MQPTQKKMLLAGLAAGYAFIGRKGLITTLGTYLAVYFLLDQMFPETALTAAEAKKGDREEAVYATPGNSRDVGGGLGSQFSW